MLKETHKDIEHSVIVFIYNKETKQHNSNMPYILSYRNVVCARSVNVCVSNYATKHAITHNMASKFELIVYM